MFFAKLTTASLIAGVALLAATGGIYGIRAYASRPAPGAFARARHAATATMPPMPAPLTLPGNVRGFAVKMRLTLDVPPGYVPPAGTTITNSAEMTEYFCSDGVRIDRPPASLIVVTEGDKTSTIITNDTNKTYFVMTSQGTPSRPLPDTLIDTRKTAMLLGHPVRHYLIDNPGLHEDILAAEDVPVPSDLPGLSIKATDAPSFSLPETRKMKGAPVAMTLTWTGPASPGPPSPGNTAIGMTTRIVPESIVEQTFPASLFAPPAGYRQVPRPGQSKNSVPQPGPTQ